MYTADGTVEKVTKCTIIEFRFRTFCYNSLNEKFYEICTLHSAHTYIKTYHDLSNLNVYWYYIVYRTLSDVYKTTNSII